MANVRCHPRHKLHKLHVWCQMKYWDLRNAAKHRKYSTKLILWQKIEISCFWIFPLYFSKISLYILDALSAVDLIQMYIVFYISIYLLYS